MCFLKAWNVSSPKFGGKLSCAETGDQFLVLSCREESCLGPLTNI